MRLRWDTGNYDLSYSISLAPGTTFQNDSLNVDLTGPLSSPEQQSLRL